MSEPTQYQKAREQFGIFGGRYVPEPLWTPLVELAAAHQEAIADEEYLRTERRWQYSRLGRPTPVTHLSSLSSLCGGAQIWAKREDLCEGGTFCATSALTQALIARRMGRQRLIGETATGDFGVALGSVGAAMGMDMTILMRRAAIEKEPVNAARMRRLGVELISVDGAGRGRSQAMAEALRQYSMDTEEAFYATSSLASPSPYPEMVARALAVIGEECRAQIAEENVELEYVIAPVGSGSFAAGLYGAFLQTGGPQLVGVQAGGENGTERSAASLVRGRPGVHLGTRSLVLQDEEGQILAPHSGARGLAIPVAGPQHARWLQEGQVHYVMIDDEKAVEAQQKLAQVEGIFASHETGYGLAYALKLAPTLRSEQHILVGISGAGLRELGEEPVQPEPESTS